LTGLAALDALNPFSVAALAYLLGTNRAVAHGMTFVAGTYVTYLLCGLLLLQGWGLALRRLIPLLPPWIPGSIEILAGGACLTFAVWAWRQGGTVIESAAPGAVGLPATFGFAVVSTAADMPTAVPYIVAVNRIAAGDLGPGSEILLLAWYVTVYIAPLALMVGARASLGVTAVNLFGPIRRAMDWGLGRLMPPALMIGGLWLLWDGARRIVG
jgi:hypothetical protein